MGLLDSGETSAPALGIDTGPRETYRPPKVVRRWDIPPAKETVRDVILRTVREQPCDWKALRQACAMYRDKEVAVTLTQLTQEHLVGLDKHGAFCYLPPKVEKQISAVSKKPVHSAEAKKVSGTINHEPKMAASKEEQRIADRDMNTLKSLTVLLAKRALETEERYQRMLKDMQAEIMSEKDRSHELQAMLLNTLV